VSRLTWLTLALLLASCSTQGPREFDPAWLARPICQPECGK